MRKKYDIALYAEEEFARAVALGVIVSQPPSAWQTLIPFMFVFDFLRRSRVIRNFTRSYMYPRRMALDEALARNRGEDGGQRLSQLEDTVKVRLKALHLHSAGVNESQTKLIKFLTDHYAKVLLAEGDAYSELIRKAYGRRGDYDAYLSRLAELEKEVDLAIIEKLGNEEELRKKMLTEKQQLERMRKESLDEIFPSED
jgi:hypothetical protein